MLFADLVGSTEMAGDQDAERTRALLTRFYDAMAAEIAEAGGTIEKFIGDAVVAAFGAPIAQEDHADRALHAALSMRSRLGQMFGDTLRLRIGVNTGEVVVGEPRVGSSFVTGDAVNVAARLEQGAKPGEILVGERTVAAARTDFQFGPATTIEAKGKAEGVACRHLIEVAAPAVERDQLGTFVGREPELDALRAAYACAEETQRPVLVTILGEPGIGKSTLVRAFRRWLATRSPRPVERIGRCRSVRAGKRLFPPWRGRGRPSGSRRAVAHPRSRAGPAGSPRAASTRGRPATARGVGGAIGGTRRGRGRSSCSWKTCTGPSTSY